MNGAFLAKGNEQGLLGGAVQAVSFALLNVLVSFLIGLSVVRLLNHRSFGLKVFGLCGLLLYLAFALGVNISLATIGKWPGFYPSKAASKLFNGYDPHPSN